MFVKQTFSLATVFLFLGFLTSFTYLTISIDSFHILKKKTELDLVETIIHKVLYDCWPMFSVCAHPNGNKKT